MLPRASEQLHSAPFVGARQAESAVEAAVDPVELKGLASDARARDAVGALNSIVLCDEQLQLNPRARLAHRFGQRPLGLVLIAATLAPATALLGLGASTTVKLLAHPRLDDPAVARRRVRLEKLVPRPQRGEGVERAVEEVLRLELQPVPAKSRDQWQRREGWAWPRGRTREGGGEEEGLVEFEDGRNAENARGRHGRKEPVALVVLGRAVKLHWCPRGELRDQIRVVLEARRAQDEGAAVSNGRYANVAPEGASGRASTPVCPYKRLAPASRCQRAPQGFDNHGIGLCPEQEARHPMIRVLVRRVLRPAEPAPVLRGVDDRSCCSSCRVCDDDGCVLCRRACDDIECEALDLRQRPCISPADGRILPRPEHLLRLRRRTRALAGRHRRRGCHQI
mmetsp:Transcript_45324/g.102338  ORF Transcript_45324/g.102338 Transcript_45324/m.102338 type:complete len:395 (+) Transcript_45324:233-1417(+)